MLDVIESMLDSLIALAIVCKCGDTLHTKPVDYEDFAGAGFFELTVDSSSDEQTIEIGAAECTGGGFETR